MSGSDPQQIAAYIRVNRDCFIARLFESDTDEEVADAAMSALDGIYGYFLAHDLIEIDTEEQRGGL